MPVAIPPPGSNSSLSSTDGCDGKDRLLDLLNGKARGEDKGDGDLVVRPQPMDILLDTCWALMAEIQQMDDPPPALNAFKSKCTHVDGWIHLHLHSVFR
jgi:hypothetical protein